MTPSRLLEPCCSHCSHTAANPCRDLIACIHEGPPASCHTSGPCHSERENRLRNAQRGGQGTLVFVGAGTCGRANGASKIMATIRDFLASSGTPATLVEVGCAGFCQREVFVDITYEQTRYCYADITPGNVRELLETVFVKGERVNRFLLGRYGDAEDQGAWSVPLVSETPFFRRQTKVVLENCGIIDPGSLDAALGAGAFSAAARALGTMTPEEVVDEVSRSGLRGRGGAGFSTGQKWRIAQETARSQKYVICNADEGDPGAFMDRAVLESDPFRVLEGLLIAAYAIGATQGYIYCRAEYPLALARLEAAIAACRQVGLLGRNVLGSLFSFDLKIKQGAGAFVCGEETAILASIEGGRGMPRARPPYPAVAGLYGKPTVLNNVETLANVPNILLRGPEWFQGLGLGGAAGTKVFALSGTIRNTGLVEVPVGIPLRTIIDEIGGGPLEGHEIKAVQIGGPSGGCVPQHELDVPTDYGSLQKLGAMMGSGGMVVMDERSCMVDVAKFFLEFIRNESCGKCTPCREGTIRLHEILTELTERPVNDEMRRLLRFRGLLHLEELASAVQETSLCGLGQTAANPVLSTIRFFRSEYEAHAFEHRCPAGACQGLRVFAVDNALCVGCLLCKRACASDAIVGERKKAHYILVDRCLGCGSCVDVCPKHAIGRVDMRAAVAESTVPRHDSPLEGVQVS